MLDRQECIDKIKANAEYIVSQFGVTSLRLFGSFARNQQRESSDVDVCVEMPPDLFQMIGLKHGEDKDKGDLLFYMNTTSSNSLGDRTDIQGVMLFIAYQAGLLGKMTNHCTYLQRANETTAILQKKSENSNKNYNIRCSFVFE